MINRFDTTMDKDMKLNTAVGKGGWMGLAVAVASDSEDEVESLSVCAPCSLR